MVLERGRVEGATRGTLILREIAAQPSAPACTLDREAAHVRGLVAALLARVECISPDAPRSLAKVTRTL